MNYLKKTKILSIRPVLFFILSQTFYSQTVLADYDYSQPEQAAGLVNQAGLSGGDSGSPIVDEIKKLEQFLGFNSNIQTKNLGNLKTSDQNSLLDQPNAQGVQPNAAAVLEDAAAQSLWSIFSANSNQLTFIPPSDGDNKSPIAQLASNLNALANILFKTVLPVSKNSDAPPGPGDNGSPVSQSVLNILSMTPRGFVGYPYTDTKISLNALGFKDYDGVDLSSVQNYFTKQAISLDQMFPKSGTNPQSHILNQVDSSVFLSPLMYNDKDDDAAQGGQTTSPQKSGPVCPGISCGLDSKDTNQLHNAVNFVRHVTGNVLPPNLPEPGDLSNLLAGLSNPSADPQKYQKNLTSLSNFVVGTRVYAARQSVGIQNIYEILARRINNPKTNQSQALSEFMMATYRLFSPTSSQATSWQNKINEASSTTVQKETALLLAEINYQLYLMRQQQERLVLTNSLLLVSNLQYPQLQGSSPN